METETRVESGTFETEKDAAVQALAALGQAITEGLSNRLAEVNRPLIEEADAQRAKAGTLREKHGEWKTRAEAKNRVLAVEIDQAVAEGRDDDAQTKRRESEELNAGLQEILRQADVCERRAKELDEERKGNIRKVFSQIYPEIPQATHAAIEAVLDLLDCTEAALHRYANGNFLLNSNSIDNLIPHRANNHALEARLDRRFGYGR